MHEFVTRAAEGLDRRRFTIQDVDRMIAAGVLDADERWELIDGEIVPMNSQYTAHARMVAKLFTGVRSLVDPSKHEAFLGATVELSQFTRVDPDLCVARAGITSDIVPIGQVLWAIEVSDSTKWRDLNVKSPLYARAGLAELWVVDVEAEATHVRRGPTPQGWAEELAPVGFDQPLAPAGFPAWSVTISALR